MLNENEEGRWEALKAYPVDLRDQWLGQIAAGICAGNAESDPEDVAQQSAEITLALLEIRKQIRTASKTSR